MTWVFLLKDKIAISTVLPHFYSMILTQFGYPIQKFQTDNARDYFNEYLHKFFQDKGVIFFFFFFFWKWEIHKTQTKAETVTS